MTSALPSSDPPTWPHQHRFEVTYHDLDVLNHLNHAVYFPFMETLRCEYYLPLVGKADPSAIDIIVAEATCRYLAPAGYGKVMIGEVAPGRPLGRTSFILFYRFWNLEHRVEYARGRTVVVSFDYSKGTKKEIPPNVRARLEKDGVEPAAAGWA